MSLHIPSRLLLLHTVNFGYYNTGSVKQNDSVKTSQVLKMRNINLSFNLRIARFNLRPDHQFKLFSVRDNLKLKIRS